MAEEKNWDNTLVWNVCNNDCGVAAGSLVWLCVQPCHFTVEHLSDVSAACTASVSSSLYRARRLSDEAMLLYLLDNAAAVQFWFDLLVPAYLWTGRMYSSSGRSSCALTCI